MSGFKSLPPYTRPNLAWAHFFSDKPPPSLQPPRATPQPRSPLRILVKTRRRRQGYLWLYSLPGAFVYSTFFSKTLFPVCLHWSELSKWMRKVKLRLDHLWVKESEEFFCFASDRLIKQQSKLHALKMYIVYIFCCKNLSVIHSEIIRDNSRFMSGKLFIASAGDIFE